MATRLGVTVLDRGSLSAASELEDFPLRLFPEWKLPLVTSAVIFAFFYIYLVIRDVIYARVEKGQDISYRIFITLGNKVTSVSVCGWWRYGGFILPHLQECLSLPGVPHRGARHAGSVLPARCLRRLHSALQRNQIQVRVQTVAMLCPILSNVQRPELTSAHSRRFPNWLDRWMMSRKQIGLLALAFAFLHAIYTLVIPIRYNVRHGAIKNAVDAVRPCGTRTNQMFQKERRHLHSVSLCVCGRLKTT